MFNMVSKSQSKLVVVAGTFIASALLTRGVRAFTNRAIVKPTCRTLKHPAVSSGTFPAGPSAPAGVKKKTAKPMPFAHTTAHTTALYETPANGTWAVQNHLTGVHLQQRCIVKDAMALTSWQVCQHQNKRASCSVCNPVTWARTRISRLADRAKHKFPELADLTPVEILGCSPEFFANVVRLKIANFNSECKPEHQITMAKITLDHIRPLASAGAAHLPLCTALELCNWRNIQPMNHNTNSKKSDSWSISDDAFWRQNILCEHSTFYSVYLPVHMQPPPKNLHSNTTDNDETRNTET